MQKKLLTSGNVFKRTDGRWCGVVWYMSEQGERKRKSFSGTTKQEGNYSVGLRSPQIQHKVENWKGTEKNQRNVNIQEGKKVVC